jgi:hypothetical protein
VISSHGRTALRHDIEYAVCADGSEPALDFLLKLRDGLLEDDPDNPSNELPDDAQISDFDHFLLACRHLAEYSEPKHSGQVNELENGIWEFKRASKRITWFDTDGVGGYSPKYKIRDRRGSPYEASDFWWFPDFDQTIRLGHAFSKRGSRTSQHDLQLSEQVREEDLDHDRP